jgi:hypothetical protein
MFPGKNHLFGGTRSKPGQGSVSADLTLASGFSLCFSLQVVFELSVASIYETAALIRSIAFPEIFLLGEAPPVSLIQIPQCRFDVKHQETNALSVATQSNVV